MRLGCSISSKNLKAVAQLKSAGYDFVEAVLNEMYGMTDGEIADFDAELKKYDFKCEAVNCLFLPDVKVTGPEADFNKIQNYLEILFEKTKRFGYEIVVFGSGGARNVPEGFTMEEANEQVEYICREILTPLASKYNFKIALEELNGGETNFMNLVSQAYDIAKRIDKTEIGIVCDSYHIALSGESYSVLEKMGEKIVHAHTANPVKRAYPKFGDGHLYADFINAMKKAGYDGRVTIESNVQNDFEIEICNSAKLFRSII